jgi:hypothetical protein
VHSLLGKQRLGALEEPFRRDSTAAKKLISGAAHRRVTAGRTLAESLGGRLREHSAVAGVDTLQEDAHGPRQVAGRVAERRVDADHEARDADAAGPRA